MRRLLCLAVFLVLPSVLLAAGSKADGKFERLAARYVDEMPRRSPAGATALGDHRWDGELDDVSAASRAADAQFQREFLAALAKIPRERLSRPNQVDYAMLRHSLEGSLFWLETSQEWRWNPLVYTGTSGGAIYNLVAREFAPLAQRLNHVAARLEQLPRFLAQVREVLQPARVPRIHAETAVRQNRGLLSIIDNMVRPSMDALSAEERERLEAAIATAAAAIDEHQSWLEETLLPSAAGDFRIGAELYERKLAFSLHTPLTSAQVRERAEAAFHRIREEMYAIAAGLYRESYPLTEFPDEPSAAFRQAVTRAGLELAYADLLPRDGILDAARAQLEQATAFVRERDLVTVPDDPVEIIPMPEFQRGVSIAYCDSPGPLDVGQKTFYAVSPIPEDWTEEQVLSFLREYNVWSLQDLTIHEAVPGHYLQLALANRYPSTLRAVLYSGTFVEGWAVYAEQFMVDEGYNGGDPRQKLIALKWLLRSVTNALMDQAIHAGTMTRDEAMQLMVEGGFQEEREAALKWVRAQLTSAQLSTYFVGYQEHADLRREMEAAWGGAFTLRRYHDAVLSHGSPPVQFVRAMLRDLPIPE